MQLHHTTGLPDWVQVAPERQNSWQRLAAATKGVVTPGNLLSLLGLGLVAAGVVALLVDHMAAGFWCIAIGRVCDVADGFAADKTGTKSPLGEVVDAAFDKFEILGVLVAFGFGHIVDWWVLAVVTLQNGANSLIAYSGRRHRVAIHPVFAGKLSTACQWTAFFCFILAAVYGATWLWPAYLLLVPALVLGFAATAVYAKALSSRPNGRAVAAPKTHNR